ncbi:MAG: NAD(P)-dependent oxidoreductase [Bacteroidetes bacterium]|nr:MAG: NAD(P)-dependent oxidoreductase [Bacteroidota bacterium]
MKRIALVTGATAGIGRATAQLLAQNQFDLIVTGRRADKLKELEDELRQEHKTGVLSLNFDIRKNEEVARAIAQLPGPWQKIDVLINNAGLAAGLGPIHEGDLNDWEQMIDTNIKGLLYISRLITPGMVKRRSGHIVNIGSIAGKEAYENGNVYNATKFAVEGLTRGMRLDLVDYGIRVSAICPGAVDTEFSLVRFRGDEDRARKVYEGYHPLHAEDIADAVLYAVTRPPHVNINDMLIMPTAQASAAKLVRKPLS